MGFGALPLLFLQWVWRFLAPYSFWKVHYYNCLSMGTFLVSLMVVAVTNSMELSPEELKAYNAIKQNEFEKVYKGKALNLIRYYYSTRMLSENEDSFDESDITIKQKYVFHKSINKLKKALNTFREARREHKELNKSITIESLVSSINQSINDEMDKLVRSSKIQVNNLMEHIKYSKEFQETLKVYVSTLETMTNRIYNQIKSDKKPNNTNKLLSIEYKPNEEMIHT